MANKNFVVHNGLTAGNVTIDAASGNVTATRFIGDGSFLTGVTSYTNSDLANALASGTTTLGNVTVSGKVVGNLIPSANVTYTLGDLTHQWKDLYVGPGSIYVNGQKVLEQQSDTIVFSADPNQNIAIRTTGTGDVEINPANTGVIALKGAVQFDDAYNFGTTSGNAVPFSVGLKASGITAYGTNATLTLAGTGTGSISLNDDVTVTGNLTVNGTTAALNVTNLNVQDNIINISSGATGAPSANAGLQVVRGDDPNVQLRWNESVDKWQFTNDGSTYANLVSGTDITTVGTLSSVTVTGAATVGSVAAGNISIGATADAITSSGTLTLDPNPTGSGGLVVIQGNLQVTGTTTTVNSTTVEVADLNITLAKDAATAAAANGAGLTVAGASATFNYASTGDKWASNKPLDVTGNMTVSGAITVNSGNNVTAIVNGGTSGTGNIGASGQTFNTIFAKATTAQYADLAEKYAADAEYEPGTVLCFGGSAEVTVCDHDADRKVAGVVTTNPAYMMNDAIAAEHSAAIALQGRVPCKVVGPIAKGDMLVSAGAGRARAEANPAVGSVIGKALEAHAEGEGVIEVAVGRF